MSELTGTAFEQWLFDPEHRTLPDFLDMPEVAFGGGLLKHDILALRDLAWNRGSVIPTHFLASIIRLFNHGIIGRTVTDSGAIYRMSTYSYEVLLHNVSYKGRVPQ